MAPRDRPRHLTTRRRARDARRARPDGGRSAGVCATLPRRTLRERTAPPRPRRTEQCDDRCALPSWPRCWLAARRRSHRPSPGSCAS
ncbi:hypothetical protein FTX61_10410 [Nitriliruptoraceae bacterium ZYF776]|nr:hypothetical protein [Profundirhabdus halotolerans]